MSKGTVEYLKHIRDECLYLVTTIKETEISKSEFFQERDTQKSRCQKFRNHWRGHQEDSDE